MNSEFHFMGGIHPQEGCGGKKDTCGKQVIVADLPSRVAIPLSQHIGAPCKPLVAKGDHVRVGQMIGEPVGGMSAAVHASVSGTVIGIEPSLLANGKSTDCVIIDNDFADEWVPLTPVANPDEMTLDDLCGLIRSAGIVGMGGATFPTAVKLNISNNSTAVDYFILNGSECEPYLTADHRLMVEHADEIIDGAVLVAKVAKIPKVLIGIEGNKPDAIKAMSEAAKKYDNVSVITLDVRYPQGGEKQLIYALTHRTVQMGALPLSVGCVVCNVATCQAIYKAVYEGRPLIERIVTVGGNVQEPANYLVRIGAPLEWLIDSSGGLLPDTRILICGGPMMGMAVSRQDIPITKGSSGIIALKKSDVMKEESACIRCGRCMKVCPMKLSPVTIDHCVRKGMYEEAKALNVMNCLECGSCAYVCPAYRKLAQSMRVAKTIIKKQASAKKGV